MGAEDIRCFILQELHGRMFRVDRLEIRTSLWAPCPPCIHVVSRRVEKPVSPEHLAVHERCSRKHVPRRTTAVHLKP
jgi:hypothetical protein